ncbi:hypothetical protein KIW84_057331 [Lathyrus oleraceus]|uniref:Uncharacterized protein n=1 Tax=Pisum sativum TaxID=3888 RepID=A0A9D4X404_PEA|nr:hypothetical protein KIW84_057331 [Pisum sativum]
MLCYDMIAKSQTGEGHLADRGKSFDRLRQFKLRLNPNKGTIGVRSGTSDSDVSRGGKTVSSVPDGLRGVYEVYWVSMTRLVEKSMQFTLAKSLPTVKQYIHCSRNLLYFGIGCSPTETVYAGSYYFVDFRDGSDQKAIKGSVLSDYIAQQPVEDYQPRKFEFPDEDISRCSDRKIESDRSRRRGLTPNPNGFRCLMGRLR